MYDNYVGTNSSVLLPDLLSDLLNNGHEIGSRAGLTKELTCIGITMTQPWQREMLTAGRKPNLAAAIAETMWVLSGRDDVAWLERYLPRAGEFSDDGVKWRGAYGDRLRRWPKSDGSGDVVDQISYIVDLLKKETGTRRAVAMLYDPARDNIESKDIPCNNWLSFISRLGKLDLHVAVRSNDAIWGWSGINVFEWSTLLEIVAGLTGLQVGSLHFSTTSFHLYGRHFDKARLIVASDSTDHVDDRLEDSPRFDMGGLMKDVDNLDSLIQYWFDLEEKIRLNPLQADMDLQIQAFPEPMMRSWLRVLQWWWTGHEDSLQPLVGTRLWAATKRSVQPAREGEKPAEVDVNPNLDAWPQKSAEFVSWITNLHDHKHEAYGDSWKKRGELFSIMPNIGRKVDRLATGGSTSDETQIDTASDLVVYLAKYICWLNDQGIGNPTVNAVLSKLADQHAVIPVWSDGTAGPNALIAYMDTIPGGSPNLNVELYSGAVVKQYENLLKAVESKHPRRVDLAYQMLDDSFLVAKKLWSIS